LEISRKKLSAILKKMGHVVERKVTAETNYLVSDSSSKTIKHKAAEEHGVTVLSVDEFLKLLGGDLKALATQLEEKPTKEE
jgi:NAD-dependent DNA ligase